MNWPVHRAVAVPRRQPVLAGSRSACRSATSPAATGRSAARCWRSWTSDDIASQGYCFQVDLAWRAVQAGFRVREVPITFTERVHGQVEDEPRIVAEALLRVTWWGVEHRAQRIRRTASRLRARLSRPGAATTRTHGRAARIGRRVVLAGSLGVRRCLRRGARRAAPRAARRAAPRAPWRAPLEQHVPVGTRRLGLLLLRLGAVDQLRKAPVQPALPHGGGSASWLNGNLELVALAGTRRRSTDVAPGHGRGRSRS